MNPMTRFKFFLWYFGLMKVPLLGHLKPKLIVLNEEEVVIKLALNHRSKNHLNSMYFGALAVGADIAGGLHGFYHAKALKHTISLAFKSFQAQFIKRPESDVFFVCNQGALVKSMIEEAAIHNIRANQFLSIHAFTNYPDQAEKVAEFTLELSVKII